MKRKGWVYIGLFVLLILGFWGVLRLVIPDFGTVKLPVLNNVKEFSFTDERGQAITDRNLEGKVYVAEYFFTTCTGICPKMNLNMKLVFDKFGDQNNFAILSHTSMPEVDSVPKMKAYKAKLLGADSLKAGNWHFLTGHKDSLYRMARESYLLDDEKNKSYNINDQFIHTQFFCLVDKNHRVRGIYDGLKEQEIQKLLTDVASLIKEPEEKGKVNNSNFNNNPD